MANLFQEGFDWIPAAGGNVFTTLSAAQYIRKGEDEGYSLVPSAFPDGGFALRQSQSGAYEGIQGWIRLLGVQRSIAYLGFRNRYFGEIESGGGTSGNMVRGSVPCVALYDAVNNTFQISITQFNFGIIQVHRGIPFQGGVLLGQTDPGVLVEGQTSFIEAKVEIGVLGSVEIRVNTEVVLSLPAVNTDNTGSLVYDSLFIGGRREQFATLTWEYDDMYLNDDEGTRNNGYLGNVRSRSALMISNGDNINMLIGGTAPALTNWESVISNPYDGTKFVYTDVPGNYDLYNVDPILNNTLVHVVQARAVMYMDDATQKISGILMKTGGVEYDPGTDIYLNQTATMYYESWEFNPNTGISWTGSEANLVQVGTKLRS